MDLTFAFINVKNLEETKSQELRRQVSRHVGKYHRNRSKPSQKKILKNDALQPQTFVQPDTKSKPDESGRRPTNNATEAPDQNISITTAEGIRAKRKHLEVVWRHIKVTSTKTATASQPTDSESSTGIQPYGKPFQPLQSIVTNQYVNLDGCSPSDDATLFRSWKCSPLSLLSQNRADAFANYPVDSPEVYSLVDHAAQHFWSLLSPSCEIGCCNPVNAISLAHMQSSRIAFYSYALVISTNLDFLYMATPRQNTFQSMRAKCIHAATKLVRESIESMPPQPTKDDVPDELVGSILALSTSDVITVKITDHPASRFESPLAAAQCIDMWSAIPFVESHRCAVIQLVKLKGGLNALNSVYLSAVVQLNELIDASRKTRKPTWPWQNMVVDPPPLKWPFVATRFSPFSNALASAFIPLTKDTPQRRELECAISAVAEVTAELEIHHHGIDSHMATMVELRNRAQHLVLDLDPISPFGVSIFSDEEEEDDIPRIEARRRAFDVPSFLHEVIRISLLIYNNLVIYPMSFASGVETRLAKQLKATLTSSLRSEVLDVVSHSNLLVWSIMLGGISTEDAEDGRWFQTQYCDIIQNGGCLQDWACTVDLLSSFIWLDFVLHEEAKKFWNACQCMFLAAHLGK